MTNNTCSICKNKLKLSETISNKCKCENLYCNNHKIPELHNCNYDYKSLNKKNLVKVEAEKITKI